MVLGVWVYINQNPGAGQMDVKGRPEVLCLFILASLGDETDRGNNLRVYKAPFLLLTISALGCFTCSTAGL